MLTEAPVKQEHYGREVWTHQAMDNLRKTQCLCRSCGRLKPGLPDNCAIAGKLYEICKADDVAMSITRCPDWIATPGSFVSAPCGGVKWQPSR